MKKPVIAIGLDAADPSLIETWMAEGHLKNMRRLQEEGSYCRLKAFECYRAETPWTTFLTGCSPNQTGYWSPVKFFEGTYKVDNIQAYDFKEYQPFYALGSNYRVAVFDMPQSALSDGVNGLQVLAWGAHSALTPRHSQPASLFQELVEQHGDHPVFDRDHADTRDLDGLTQLKQSLEVGIARRTAICQDLLQRDQWDLFLTVFGETHSAGHFFWHLSQADQPLHTTLAAQATDLMLETFVAVDRAIGTILDSAPDDAQVVVFAAHGMGTNVMDLPSMLFLPEVLYRYNFPDRIGLAQGDLNAPLPAPLSQFRRDWLGEVWRLKHEPTPIHRVLRQKGPNKVYKIFEKVFGAAQSPDLISPFDLVKDNDPFYYQPANWYRHFWPSMRAFALPSFSEGYVRINLKGREPQGIVEEYEYESLCQELTEMLYRLTDGRTGNPMVREVIRTRQSASDRHPKLPDADLVVLWQEDYATDVVDSPDVGRIGPVPYLRTGSHRARGFVLAKGDGIPVGVTLEDGHALDLAPTILSLLDAPIPNHYEGKSLFPKVALPI